MTTFAKDLGDENLEAFRTRVRSELLAHAKQEADARVRQGLLDLVIERNPVELPESLVARESCDGSRVASDARIGRPVA